MSDGFDTARQIQKAFRRGKSEGIKQGRVDAVRDLLRMVNGSIEDEEQNLRDLRFQRAALLAASASAGIGTTRQ